MRRIRRCIPNNFADSSTTFLKSSYWPSPSIHTSCFSYCLPPPVLLLIIHHSRCLCQIFSCILFERVSRFLDDFMHGEQLLDASELGGVLHHIVHTVCEGAG